MRLQAELGRPLTENEILSLAKIKVSVPKRNALEITLDLIQTARDKGFYISEEQKNQMINEALGGKTATQIGAEEAEKKVAERNRLREQGILPKTDFNDETGNLNTKTSNAISARLTEAMGGVYDVATGKSSNLTPEQAELVPGLAAQVGELLLDGKFKDINAALNVVLQGVPNLPKGKTALEVGREVLSGIQNPTGKSIKEDAADFDKIDLNSATGFQSAVIDIFGKIAGQASNSFVDQQNAEDRNKLKMLAHEFMVANAKSGGRISVFEQQRLQKIFSGPSVFESGESMRAAFRSIDNNIGEEIDNRLAALKITTLPVKDRIEIFSDIRTLGGFQKKLRQFDMTPGGSEVVEFKSAEEVRNASKSDFNKFLDKQTRSSMSLQRALIKFLTQLMRGNRVSHNLLGVELKISLKKIQ
jgi:hypothetical protein